MKVRELLNQAAKFDEWKKEEIADKLRNQALRQFEQHIIKKCGNFDEWFDWAKSLYEITPNYTVVSKAANWKQDMSWDCGSQVEALMKIEELIGYKIQDRKRGIGNMESDIS